MANVGPLVLLVEDEPQMRRFLRTTLRAHDCQVVEAGTAREALAQAAGRNPDLILLDLGLPDGDGLEVAREIRRSGRTPIIVISA
ncbi:MAG TPA: response regulator, partial [Gemmatimonadales bacterium]|nr:response regulator [Gemmatimonadales bacterium]